MKINNSYKKKTDHHAHYQDSTPKSTHTPSPKSLYTKNSCGEMSRVKYKKPPDRSRIYFIFSFTSNLFRLLISHFTAYPYLYCTISKTPHTNSETNIR